MNKQWEVGKTYKLVDVKAFRQDDDSTSSNNEIADKLESFNYTFTVLELDANGYVTKTDNLCSTDLEFFVLFNSRDLGRVKVVNSVALTNCTVSKDPVVEWLDKLHYVFSNDNSIGRISVGTTCVFITTDFGDISGTQQVVEFINNRYDLLQKEAKSNKQKELAEKKAKLLDELSAIDKELEGI